MSLPCIVALGVLMAPSGVEPVQSSLDRLPKSNRDVGHARLSLAQLRQELDTVCRNFRGRMGYCLKVLKTGETISFRGDERFPTASTIKTAVMMAAVQMIDEGKLKWSDKRAVPPMSGRQASMWAYHFKDGVAPDVDGWVNLMITVSDNTATMVLREWLGPENINERLAKLGLKNTKVLANGMQTESDRRLRGMFGLGVTTPNEMNHLLELIHLRKAASLAGCERMIRILGKQYWDDAIGASVPPHIQVASKSGAINRSRSDTAIVYSSNPYILTIYTDSQKDQRWVPDNEGDRALLKLSRMVWANLHPSQPYGPPEGSDKFAPTGGGG